MSPTANVTLLSPVDTSSHTVRVNLFLYRVVRSPHLNNREWQPKVGVPGQLVFPPLSLILYYLLTPFSPPHSETGLADTHGLMGEAMRVFYENAIVSQEFLETGLTAPQVKVTLVPAEVEELSKIWTALNAPYRLSAVYEISFVDVPAQREMTAPKNVEKTDVSVITTS
jgi:hypothetical protein